MAVWKYSLVTNIAKFIEFSTSNSHNIWDYSQLGLLQYKNTWTGCKSQWSRV